MVGWDYAPDYAPDMVKVLEMLETLKPGDERLFGQRRCFGCGSAAHRALGTGSFSRKRVHLNGVMS